MNYVSLQVPVLLEMLKFFNLGRKGAVSNLKIQTMIISFTNRSKWLFDLVSKAFWQTRGSIDLVSMVNRLWQISVHKTHEQLKIPDNISFSSNIPQ